MSVLSKSRFKLGLECPNKLFFTSNNEYANEKKEDPFLLSLAEGGFQVEAYARMHYADGQYVVGNERNYEEMATITSNLMDQDNVILFEAAFLHEGLYVKTDILEKRGNIIRVIEVKSKSYDPTNDYYFVGKRGGLESKWKPYLFDLAFQTYVVQKSNPNALVIPYLMLADKSKVATINGLNQKFRVPNQTNNIRQDTIILAKNMAELGESVLSEVRMTDLVQQIIDGQFVYNGIKFKDAVEELKSIYTNNFYAEAHLGFSKCKKCEFHNSMEPEKLSGKVHCFNHHWDFSIDDLYTPNIFEIWDLKNGNNVFGRDKFFLDDFEENDLNIKEGNIGLSHGERQWLQIEKVQNRDNTIYKDKDYLKEELNKWVFPLHFIDFETSTLALPFTEGMRPYEAVAFQYSHHLIGHDGSIEHKGQLILDAPGTFPNFEFVRKLKKELEQDEGTIFRYSHHENTILLKIYDQLEVSNELDNQELMDFIKSITTKKADDNKTIIWQGERTMVDLCDIIKKGYYNPLMKGSNSIKAVLPAVLKSSVVLQQKYSQTLDAIGLNSLNFEPTHRWLDLNLEDIDPYKNLPPLFEDMDIVDQEDFLTDFENINNGGTALIAYAKLQYQDMSQTERNELVKGLLKYCELDTLAMVMVYEHLKEII